MSSYSESATELFEMAVERLKSGDSHGAISHFSLSLQCEERPSTYFERAKLYQKNGDLEKAVSDLERAITLCKQSADEKDLRQQLVAWRDQILPDLNQKRSRQDKLSSLSTARDFDGLLDAFELTPFRDAILGQAEMSVRLRLSEDRLDSARSKFGGLPDLPGDLTWPCSASGAPLSFLAQLDLSELLATCAGGIFGGEGLLSFFYDADQQPWGFDPKDREGWKVFYFPITEKLVKSNSPVTLADYCVFAPCKLSFEDELTFAGGDSVSELKMSFDEESRYYDLCSEWYGDGVFHRLLGHPQLIQSDWRLECQLASNGIYVGDPSGYKSESARELEGGANKWKLLLQLDSDEMTGMQWGDVGRLYFCIDEPSLSKADSNNIWTILQCY